MTDPIRASYRITKYQAFSSHSLHITLSLSPFLSLRRLHRRVAASQPSSPPTPLLRIATTTTAVGNPRAPSHLLHRHRRHFIRLAPSPAGIVEPYHHRRRFFSLPPSPAGIVQPCRHRRCFFGLSSSPAGTPEPHCTRFVATEDWSFHLGRSSSGAPLSVMLSSKPSQRSSCIDRSPQRWKGYEASAPRTANPVAAGSHLSRLLVAPRRPSPPAAMPKKMGVNTKAEAARESRSAAEADRRDRDARAKEEAYWAGGRGPQDALRREEDAEKRAEAASSSLPPPCGAPTARPRASAAPLSPRSPRPSCCDAERRSGSASSAEAGTAKKRQARTAEEDEYERVVLVANTNRDDSIIEARSVEDAIAKMSITAEPALPPDRHPERRYKVWH